MDEKYRGLVKEAEALFDDIIKESSFSQEKRGFDSFSFMHDDRKVVNVSLTNKT